MGAETTTGRIAGVWLHPVSASRQIAASFIERV